MHREIRWRLWEADGEAEGDKMKAFGDRVESEGDRVEAEGDKVEAVVYLKWCLFVVYLVEGCSDVLEGVEWTYFRPARVSWSMKTSLLTQMAQQWWAEHTVLDRARSLSVS